MAIVLGIDPGSRFTGWGIVEAKESAINHVDHGVIRVDKLEMPLRLKEIYLQISDLIEAYRVERLAIETSFVSSNPQTAIKLGQARGVAIAAGAVQGLAVGEYTPRQIKQATVSVGSASKEQVQYMIKLLLNLDELPPTDSADALAVAICDVNSTRYGQSIEKGVGIP